MPGDVFKMVTESSGGDLNFSFSERAGDLVPNLLVRFHKRTGVDGPAMEGKDVLAVTRPADFICSAHKRSCVVMMNCVLGK